MTLLLMKGCRTEDPAGGGFVCCLAYRTISSSISSPNMHWHRVQGCTHAFCTSVDLLLRREEKIPQEEANLFVV